jgi:uncharacterized protein (DUF1778 family)
MESKIKKGEKKRLIADIHQSLHERIKTAAAIKNLNIKTYILQAIIRVLIEDEKNRY